MDNNIKQCDMCFGDIDETTAVCKSCGMPARRKDRKRKKSALKIFIFEKLIVPFNKFRSLFGIKIENQIPRFIIHEKYKNIVKWATRGIITISILSSLLYFPVRYISLSFSLLLYALERVLEKSIFRFTTLYISPMPDFKYNTHEWNGMGYMYTPDIRKPSFFGPSFITKEYAIKMFNLLLAWNYGSHYDKAENICISFIEEEKDDYSVYFYPSLNRRSIKEFKEKVAKDVTRKDMDHYQLILNMILCQSFPLHSKSNYLKWKELLLKGQPACLGIFIYDEEKKEIKPIADVTPIRIYKINFKKRKELTKNDMEYSHGKYIMGV
jgi:hypothetical protein